MAEVIFNFFSGISKEFALFMISLIPLIEERGALIYAASVNIPWQKALPICILANMLPVPLLLLFGMKIIQWLKTTKLFGKFFTKYEKKLYSKSDAVRKYGFWALTIFVGIPIPGTGAWSGTLVATILEFKYKKALLSIFLGVILAGIIMCIACYGTVGIFKFFA